MAQKVFKVTIGGIEYKLTGEDEASLQSAADEVNRLLDDLQTQYDVKLPINTLSVLAALNLAEAKVKEEKRKITENAYFQDEIDKMIEHLNSALR